MSEPSKHNENKFPKFSAFLKNPARSRAKTYMLRAMNQELEKRARARTQRRSRVALFGSVMTLFTKKKKDHTRASGGGN